jgi:hypothetical protein
MVFLEGFLHFLRAKFGKLLGIVVKQNDVLRHVRLLENASIVRNPRVIGVAET